MRRPTALAGDRRRLSKAKFSSSTEDGDDFPEDREKAGESPLKGPFLDSASLSLDAALLPSTRKRPELVRANSVSGIRMTRKGSSAEFADRKKRKSELEPTGSAHDGNSSFDESESSTSDSEVMSAPPFDFFSTFTQEEELEQPMDWGQVNVSDLRVSAVLQSHLYYLFPVGNVLLNR